jgi:hypothetical protein
MNPLNEAEVRDLLSATLHGPLPQTMVQRLLATVARDVGAQNRIAELEAAYAKSYSKLAVDGLVAEARVAAQSRIAHLEASLRHIAESGIEEPDTAQFAARAAEDPPSALPPESMPSSDWRAGWNAAVGALSMLADEAERDGLYKTAAIAREAAENLRTAQIVPIPKGTMPVPGGMNDV